MTKLILVLMALPLFSYSQENNVVSVNRVFVKPGKVSAFEKALTAHAQKYHTGTWKWRISTVESGPDAGAYHIVEGPVSWDHIDGRGDLGKAHMADWDLNIIPLLTERGTHSYYEYRSELSTIQLSDNADKSAINRVFFKPGYGGEVEEAIKKLKKAWEAGGSTVAVYEASSSGAPHYAIVTRYKQGLKERSSGFRTPMKERFIKANGDKSWDEFMQMQRNAIDHSWSELLFYRANLSSK